MELNEIFIDGLWSQEINVTSFVQTNITPYTGDASFLVGPTERTKHLWDLCLKALEEERKLSKQHYPDDTRDARVESLKLYPADLRNFVLCSTVPPLCP